MNRHGNWLLNDYHYWLPRAKRRIDDLMQYGHSYDWVDGRCPTWAVADDDIRGFRETKRQLEEITLETDFEYIIIAQARLESHCELIYTRKKSANVTKGRDYD